MEKLNLAALAAGAPIKKEARNVVVQAPPQNEVVANPQPTPAAYTIDPKKVYNANFMTINTTLLNTSGGALDLILGTLLADPANQVGLGAAGIALANGNAGVADKAGANTPFIVVLAKRIIAQPIIVQKVSIFTGNAAADLAQRNNPINGITFDFNNSSCQDTGRIPVSDVDLSAVETTVPIALGPEVGIRYTLNNNVQVTLQLEIAAVAVPQFTPGM